MSNRYANQLSMAFELPTDLREVYLQFGIDLEKYNGDASWQLPLPGRIVVGTEGVIRSIEADPDYTVRPEPEQTLELLQRL